MPTSVAADAARVNVQVFLRQADDGPAARVDLDVLVGPRAPRESPAIGRRGLLPAATFHPPAIEDDVDAFLVGEDMPQVLVQLPPLRGQRRGERRRSPRYPPPVTRGGVSRASIAPAKPALETSTTGRERFSIGPPPSRWAGAGRPKDGRARTPRRRPGRPHRRSDARRFAVRSAAPR